MARNVCPLRNYLRGKPRVHECVDLVAGEDSDMRFIAVGDAGAGAVGRRAPGKSGRWLSRLLQPWADRRFARTESQRALRLYDQVHQERPDLQGHVLYEEIVRRCPGAASECAVQVVRRAEDSFAAWPAARDVRFRDVVAYMVIDRLIVDGHRTNMSAEVERVISKVIPRGM